MFDIVCKWSRKKNWSGVMLAGVCGLCLIVASFVAEIISTTEQLHLIHLLKFKAIFKHRYNSC